MPSYLSPINLNKNEIQNARVQNLGSAPGSPVTGQLYYDSGTNKLMWYNGSTWVAAEPGTPTLDFAEVADMVASAPGDTVSEGTSPEISRGDHRHAREAYATVTELNTVDAATEAAGSSPTVPRGDHKHALSTGSPVASAVGDTTSDGTSNNAARTDHRHPREAFGNVAAQTSFGASSNNGAATTVARGDHLHGTPTHLTADHSGVVLSGLAAPTTDVALGGFKITNLADPSNPTDAANKQYVDGLAQGVAWKETVRAATTTTGTLASAFANGQTLDGVTLATGDRILIKNQSSASENGIYVVAVSGAPTRATDADSAADILQAATWVQEGTTQADSGWVMTTNAPITLNTTSLTFVQFSGLGQITAGNGLTQTGNTIDVVAGTGLAVTAGDVAVLRTDANGRVPIKFAVAYGDGAATSFNIDHNLNSLDVIVQVFTVSSGVEVEVDKTRSTVNRVVLTHAVAPTSGQYRAVVYG